ncbi:MAG: leucine-rich repeat domain-containing protein [Lachnospiraceae bacterium]|nr:leucine-rich repeat domain-containing protein [Lachnospiraceae bacterium]
MKLQTTMKFKKRIVKGKVGINIFRIFILFIGMLAVVSTKQIPEVLAATLSNPRTDANGDVTYDCIYFGHYPQSDATGKTSDPIKWRVLSVDGNDAFLVADTNLDVQKYNDTNVSVTWETCTMRSWLNGYGSDSNVCGTDYSINNFIDRAFSTSEQNAIKTTTVVNADNPYCGTAGGNNTQDKIFLLSYDEVTNMDYGFSPYCNALDNGRKRTNTAYVAEGGTISSSFMYSEGSTDLWWLRSSGGYTECAATVYRDGSVDRTGNCVVINGMAVCPALHLDISSSNLWSYAGTVSFEERLSEGEELLDIEKCSVFPKNAGPGETVTWKLKFRDDFKCSDLNLDLVYPNNHWETIYNWILDEDGYYVFSFTVPTAGYNGNYEVDIYYSDGSVVDNLGRIQDLSGLNLQVEGLAEDREAPIVDVEKTEVSFDGDTIRIHVPVKDELSGVDGINILFAGFNKADNIWDSLWGEIYMDESNWIETEDGYIVEEKLEDFLSIYWNNNLDEIEIFGISEIWTYDIAGNEKARIILPDREHENERIGLEVIPSHLRFSLGDTEIKQEEKPSVEQPDSPQKQPETPPQSTADTEPVLPDVGITKAVSTGTYIVTKSSAKQKEVAYIKPTDKNKTSINIPASVNIDGYTYKVTGIASNALANNKKLTKVTVGKNITTIGKNAFNGDKNLKTITIKSSKLTSKSIGKNAFKGTNKKLIIKVPKKKVKDYSKFMKKKGNKNIKVKK